MVFRLILLLCLVTVASIPAPRPAAAGEADGALSVGVLKFGTVNWQLDTVKAHHLDRAAGVSLKILPLASKNATSVALQAGEVDLIVSDWVWVMRQRASGADFAFVPYSHALGALVVAADSGVERVADLAGKRIGVAGGPLDKSWLILRAWSERELGFDIGARAAPVFGAPPLLNEQLRRGDLDAVLTFWPYAARLEAQGYRRLAMVSKLLADLGIEGPLSLVGYVFREGRARERRDDYRAFFDAVVAANRILATSDPEWDRLRPVMKAGSDAEFERLKAGFRVGLPKEGSMSLTDAEALYRLLAKHGGEKLLGRGTHFDPNAFWTFGAR